MPELWSEPELPPPPPPTPFQMTVNQGYDTVVDMLQIVGFAFAILVCLIVSCLINVVTFPFMGVLWLIGRAKQ